MVMGLRNSGGYWRAWIRFDVISYSLLLYLQFFSTLNKMPAETADALDKYDREVWERCVETWHAVSWKL